MPHVQAISLAEFSRRYLSAKSAASEEKTASELRQMTIVGQNGFAEHVFLAMAKPDDKLTVRYPQLGRP